MTRKKARRKPVTFRPPSPSVTAGLLGKRTRVEHEMLIATMEPGKLRSNVREGYAAKLLLDFPKIDQDQRDRFVAIMQKGTPDERRRIDCALKAQA